MHYVEVKIDDTHAQGTGPDRIWTLRPAQCPADEGRSNPLRACFAGGFNADGERVVGVPCVHADVNLERKHEDDGRVLQPCCYGDKGVFGRILVRHG